MIINNKRMTSQRIKVLQYLKSVKNHPTAEVIYREVKKDLPSITLATVYRNLNILAENKDIQRLEINGEFHFDGDTCNHQHFICNNCKKIFDIFDKTLSNAVLRNINKDKNFQVSCVNIIYRGLCKECMEVN